MKETHPYQVSIWVEGNGKPNSIWEHSAWSEQARCRTISDAEEVATCLSLRWRAGVCIAEAVEGKFVPLKYIPETAKELK